MISRQDLEYIKKEVERDFRAELARYKKELEEQLRRQTLKTISSQLKPARHEIDDHSELTLPLSKIRPTNENGGAVTTGLVATIDTDGIPKWL